MSKVKAVKAKNTHYVEYTRARYTRARASSDFVFGRNPQYISAVLSAVADERRAFSFWHAPCKDRGNNASSEADKQPE